MHFNPKDRGGRSMFIFKISSIFTRQEVVIEIGIFKTEFKAFLNLCEPWQSQVEPVLFKASTALQHSFKDPELGYTILASQSWLCRQTTFGSISAIRSSLIVAVQIFNCPPVHLH